MTEYSPEDSTVLRDTQDWGTVLSSGSAQQCDAFAQWVRGSKAHVSTLLQDIAINVELAGLDINREFDLERLLAEVAQSYRVSPVDSNTRY